MDFQKYQTALTQRIEAFLATVLPHETKEPILLHKALRYAVLNGGKRIRPLLVYTTGEALGASLETLDAAAAAVELIHCYSLIHDDLPCMDNDDLRRGKPTCHKVFGEGIALLAGDALQSLAFELLAHPILNPTADRQKIKMVQLLSEKIGPSGMVGGQVLDVENDASNQNKKSITMEELTRLHHLKTSELIEASVGLGAIAAHCSDSAFTELQQFAKALGLAFQIQDDILDVTGTQELLGKTIGRDEKQHKTTFVTLLGIKGAEEKVVELYENALSWLTSINLKNHFLTDLSQLLIARKC